jgi:hypothetical protein
MQEITIAQAREIARLRRRHPAASVLLHHRAHDLIVEVQRRGHTVTLERFGEDGTVLGEHPVLADAA